MQGGDAADTFEDQVSSEGQGALGEAADVLSVGAGQAVRDGLGRVKDQREFPGDLGAFGMFGMKGMAEGVGAVKLIKNEGGCTGGANGFAFAEISFEEEFECIDLLQGGRTATGEGEVGIQGCRKGLFVDPVLVGCRISPSSCRGDGLGLHCGAEVRVIGVGAAPWHIKGHAFQSHANLLAVALFDPLEKGNLCGVDDEHRFRGRGGVRGAGLHQGHLGEEVDFSFTVRVKKNLKRCWSGGVPDRGPVFHKTGHC